MDNQRDKPGDQATNWKGGGARGWVASQQLLDQLFAPIDELIVKEISAGTPSRVLDIGCGTGSTTLAVARSVGAHATCAGIDISEGMIAAARARVAREGASVELIVGDAQTYPFAPARFDALISRFGVMFFADPVAAFANLRRAATADAMLRFIVWRGPEENPFMTTAERAAAPLLPNLPVRTVNEPGQFGLADRDRTQRFLESSGWRSVDIQPVDVSCAMPESALVSYLTNLGPVGRILQDADDELRARAIDAIRPAFDGYLKGAEVRFTAACWICRSGP